MPSIRFRPKPFLSLALLASTALCACGKPQPPEKEQPPEPQARHTELRDAVRKPIDQAKQVEQQVQDAADSQRAAIEAAGG